MNPNFQVETSYTYNTNTNNNTQEIQQENFCGPCQKMNLLKGGKDGYLNRESLG